MTLPRNFRLVKGNATASDDTPASFRATIPPVETRHLADFVCRCGVSFVAPFTGAKTITCPTCRGRSATCVDGSARFDKTTRV